MVVYTETVLQHNIITSELRYGSCPAEEEVTGQVLEVRLLLDAELSNVEGEVCRLMLYTCDLWIFACRLPVSHGTYVAMNVT
jgi:hypothetical protein